MHLYGLTQTVPGLQPVPPHWPHSATVPAVVGVEEATVEAVKVVGALLVVLAPAGEVEAGDLPVAVLSPEAEFNTLRTLVYAGFAFRLLLYRSAAPWPLKVLGTQL